ncbi:MAG: hypothetical protein ACMXYA_00210 [Candidatus Woesearchaeota archaeon]
MDIIIFILFISVVYLSFYIGGLITRLTPEELKPGKKYFHRMESILTILFFGILLLLYSSWILFAVLIILLIGIFQPMYKYTLFFGLFPVIAYLIFADIPVLFLVTAIFVLLQIVWASDIGQKHVTKEKFVLSYKKHLEKLFLLSYPYLMGVGISILLFLFF